MHFIFFWAAAALVVAEEKASLSSRTFTAAEAGLNYGNNQMAEHAIDERIIDRLGCSIPRQWPVHSLQRIARLGE